MVFVFLLLRPYKDDKVNGFSVINEATLVIVGFYLFFFLEESAGNEFYAWLMIIIVIFMVAWNLTFILAMKFRDVWTQLGEKRRVDRLRKISEVEQKYLYFDYRKFFLSSLSQQVRFHKEEIVKGQRSIYQEMHGKDMAEKAQLRPTELFKHLEESLNDTRDPPQGTTPTPEDGPDYLFNDSISPEPHVLEQPSPMWKPDEETKEPPTG